MQEKKVTLLVTPQQVGGGGEGMLHTERLEIPEEYMELARGIEPPTAGLQINRSFEAIQSDLVNVNPNGFFSSHCN